MGYISEVKVQWSPVIKICHMNKITHNFKDIEDENLEHSSWQVFEPRLLFPAYPVPWNCGWVVEHMLSDLAVAFSMA